MLLMLDDIAKAVGHKTLSDPEVQVLEQATEPEALSRQIDQATKDDRTGDGGSGAAST
jgi:hypothetical protein